MRQVRRDIPQPASLNSQAAVDEREAAAEVARLRVERLRSHKLALDEAERTGAPRPKLPKLSPQERKFEFKAYKASDIRSGLEELFHGKCAYCETLYRHQAPVDIEHYRPKSAVEGDDLHPGYWWLAADWGNLLPSCIDCNRRRTQVILRAEADFVSLVKAISPKVTSQAGKKGSFPIAGESRCQKIGDDLKEERPYFLNPTIDDPDEHLVYYLDHERDGVEPLAIILPKILLPGHPDRAPGTPDSEPGPSARGMMTIQFCGLNRLHLVQERTAVLRRLEFLRALILRIDAVTQDLNSVIDQLPGPIDRKLRDVAQTLDGAIDRIFNEISSAAEPTRPYCSLARHWMKRWSDELTASRVHSEQ